MFLYHCHCLIDNKSLQMHKSFHLPFIYNNKVSLKINILDIYNMLQFLWLKREHEVIQLPPSLLTNVRLGHNCVKHARFF